MNENYSFRLTLFFIAFDLEPAATQQKTRKKKAFEKLSIWSFEIF